MKNYNKPEIIFDEFELSQSIAAGCEFTQTLNDGKSCSLTYEGYQNVFVAGSCATAKIGTNFKDTTWKDAVDQLTQTYGTPFSS